MNDKRPRIAVIGSTNVDFCSYVARLPQAGETIGNGVFMQANGGKGANQAVAAARLGGDVSFVTAIGTDSIGDALLKHFENEGIDRSAVSRIADVSTGIALIVIDKKGENIITVNPGANAMLTCECIAAVKELIAGVDAVVMQAEIPYSSVKCAAQLAHDAGVAVIYNPAPVCEVDDEMMALTDVMILNQTEAAILSGSEDTAEAAQRLLNRGVKKCGNNTWLKRSLFLVRQWHIGYHSLFSGESNRHCGCRRHVLRSFCSGLCTPKGSGFG